MANEEKGKKKVVTIIIDGTPYKVEKDDMTYVELVTLADPEYPQHPETTYSVTYKRGQGNKPEGTLSPGGSVKIKEGMVFNVSRTGQS
ncbi:multiubiquitin domain-containing protein (plasmid) [Ensifer adhaerens]|uniref:multiubiquitin domain-containing protein n=1 Tax=Ensifer adhaerens TaxID=106592 RepID=UPI002100C4D1|nr:multiubiquitin domain-containing protein [Ensifer adhaerens]UTV40737.1 multiubiquitin domain-containing protein [Ensifer adhaerens]